MSVAYLDTSVLAAIAFDEPGAAARAQRLEEFATVLDTGYLRGAELRHVATALYVSCQSGSLSFVTRDARQSAVAEALGFLVLREAKSP